MMRILVCASFLLLLAVVGLRGVPAQEPGASNSDEARFTGKTEALETTGLRLTRRRFEAGARSAWHSHDRGQLLFVADGRGRVRRRGQPLKEMGQGESDYTGPGVVHWHGAAPGQAVVQIAVSMGGETRWLEKVTDEEYMPAGK
jgi:quercetin dioxygenase-like cupin family protein